jgi:hypothetical protein
MFFSSAYVSVLAGLVPLPVCLHYGNVLREHVEIPLRVVTIFKPVNKLVPK